MLWPPASMTVPLTASPPRWSFALLLASWISSAWALDHKVIEGIEADITNKNQCTKNLSVNAEQEYWKTRAMQFIRSEQYDRQKMQTTDRTTGNTYNLDQLDSSLASAIRGYFKNMSITAA